MIDDDNEFHGSVCPVMSKPAGKMAAANRSFKPMIDSGSVVSTCPPWYAPGVATKETKYHLNLESVLGEKLKHYGFKEGVAYKNGLGEAMKVGYEVTDSTRPILSVQRSTEVGQMTVFGPSVSKIINDPKVIQDIEKILNNVNGIDIIIENGAYVMDVTLDKDMQDKAEPGIVAPQVTVSTAGLERAGKVEEKIQRAETIELEKHVEEVVDAEMSHEVRAKVAPAPYTQQVQPSARHTRQLIVPTGHGVLIV